MPDFLLHVGATVMCMHGGHAEPAEPDARVLVDGQPIVTQPKLYRVTGCPFNVGGGPSPCVTAQWLSASKRLVAGRQPVLLHTSEAKCTPNGTSLKAMLTQTRVTGA